MAQPDHPTGFVWGYEPEPISVADIVASLRRATVQALVDFEALPDGPEPCNDKPGYCRVSITIPLPRGLLDQLMNGPTGYRAHYSIGTAVGGSFNQALVDAVVDSIVESEQLYADRFTRQLCSDSLRGPFTKVWYSKQLTDPSAQQSLETLPEVLRVPHWNEYWEGRGKPRKGLLVPIPQDTSILLNGSFISDDADVYEQKPGRSKQLFESGWT